MVRIKDGAVSFKVEDPAPEDDEIYGPPNTGYLTISPPGAAMMDSENREGEAL